MPEQMMEQEQAPPADQPPGDVTSLIQNVGDGLTQLMDMFEKGGAEDADKQALGSLVQQFQALVQKMNSPEGPPPPQAEEAMNENQSAGAQQFNG